VIIWPRSRTVCIPSALETCEKVHTEKEYLGCKKYTITTLLERSFSPICSGGVTNPAAEETRVANPLGTLGNK
jgi:hypothetical protein